MKSQKEFFLQSEGNAWFRRNRDAIGKKEKSRDPFYGKVLELLAKTGRQPPVARGTTTGAGEAITLLEVGCADGYRLNWFRDDGLSVLGIDPGKAAIESGRESYGLGADELLHADAGGFFQANSNKFDFILFGHCLYLIEPREIPSIVAGAIDAVKVGGFILIFDFDSSPQAQAYHHVPGLSSYKARYDTFFTWFPQMHLVEKSVMQHSFAMTDGNPKEDCALSVLKKIAVNYAYPTFAGDIST